MKRFILHKRTISLLFLLSYLLVGSGVAHSLIWCQESREFAHLEYNPAGRCQDVCLSKLNGADNDSQPAFGLVPVNLAGDCQDSQGILAHVNGPENNLIHQSAPTWQPILQTLAPSAFEARLGQHLRLDQPPPSLTLTTLRTIVLLI